MNKTFCKHGKRLSAMLLVVVMVASLFSTTAFAAQEDNYHDPAEHWLTSSNRTNELDVNAVLTHETFHCAVCQQPTSFSIWRTPEYTRDGVTALSRNVLYSDGTLIGGEGTGRIFDGTPGVDAYYTGYHWTKSMCDTCGTMNSNSGLTGYDFNKNVYNLYDCAAEFIIDRCTASVYRPYQQRGYTGDIPTLQDFRMELLSQDEPEAKELALAIELFTDGSLNTFAKETNVDTDKRLICYDILDLGKQLMPIGMLVVLDSILNRITENRAKGKNTYIFIDEIYLLFQHEYSANFLFTLWKRVRKYGAFCTGITQNVDDLLQSHTARTMLANSEFIIMLNQASTDRLELAKLLNISDLQMSYITNVEAGHGLIKVGSSLVPFVNKFPRNTKLYGLMTTKPGEGS